MEYRPLCAANLSTRRRRTCRRSDRERKRASVHSARPSMHAPRSNRRQSNCRKSNSRCGTERSRLLRQHSEYGRRAWFTYASINGSETTSTICQLQAAQPARALLNQSRYLILFLTSCATVDTIASALGLPFGEGDDWLTKTPPEHPARPADPPGAHAVGSTNGTCIDVQAPRFVSPINPYLIATLLLSSVAVAMCHEDTRARARCFARAHLE